MTAPIDYQAVLADLEARRLQIDAAINVIRGLIGAPQSDDSPSSSGALAGVLQTPLSPPVGAPPMVASGGIKNDTFFGLSTPEAIRKYLSMVKRPQKVSDISKALLDGGQIHARDGTTAYNNAYASLKRMRKAGTAVRIKSGEWALAEWYGSSKPKSESE